MKKKGQYGLIGLGREKPCKNFEGKQQKMALIPWPIEERERKAFETVNEYEMKYFSKTLVLNPVSQN